ncbi:MAG: hypothetical protein JHC33_07820 [Ignisphaera sp.]|nr:hypothetical protein [Ignisphaera sp.]
MKTKKIILLSGKKRSGKSTAAGLLKTMDNSVKEVAFAAPLKQILADTFNVPSQELDKWKNNDRYCIHDISPEDDVKDMVYEVQSYRAIMQNFGDSVKRFFGKDVWSHKAYELIQEYFQFVDTVVVSDWRYINEYTYLAKMFKNVKIVTVRINTIDMPEDIHSSETELDDYAFDIIIDNIGTLEDFKQNLKELL